MDKIYIHEVGLRDGLQAESTVVPLIEKIHWIKGLFATGIDIIQLGSFVNPVKVPQMTDTDALFRYFADKKPADVTLSGLVLNEKGLERGLACGVEMFCLGVSASETHSQKNTGMTSAEARQSRRTSSRQEPPACLARDRAGSQRTPGPPGDLRGDCVESNEVTGA